MYYIQKQFQQSSQFFKKEGLVQKIRRFLEEVERYYLNPAKIPLKHPLYEIVTGGKLIYIGDTHGAVEDTDKIIRYAISEIEKAEKTKKELRIIFIGDYVDRDPNDIHNILYILAFALKYPRYVRLLRGNHEEVTINMQYGFWENLNEKLPNSYLFNNFEYLFRNLPLIHVVGYGNKKIMALHGGIPFYDDGYDKMPEIPNLMTGEVEIDSRHPSVDEMDVLTQQILWSDPVEHMPPYNKFLPNPRGLGYTFGQEVFDKWCDVNHIDRVIRGHEVFLAGYKEFFNHRLFSIFSNSDYVGRNIQAKILVFDLDKPWSSNWHYLDIQSDLET